MRDREKIYREKYIERKNREKDRMYIVNGPHDDLNGCNSTFSYYLKARFLTAVTVGDPGGPNLPTVSYQR